MACKIIAHRGANKKAPQNTMPAFRQAVLPDHGQSPVQVFLRPADELYRIPRAQDLKIPGPHGGLAAAGRQLIVHRVKAFPAAPDPAASRIAITFLQLCSVCASIPSAISPVAGSIGIWPDV